MNSLTETQLTAAGFPDALRPYLLNGTLVFSHARPDGTLEFMIPNEAEPKSAFTLVWHPEDPATWDFESRRFYVNEAKYRDIHHHDPLGGDQFADIGNIDEEPAVPDLMAWLDELPGCEPRSAGVPPAVPPASRRPAPVPTEPDRHADNYLPACPHCRSRAHIRELDFWSLTSKENPSNTCTAVEYQCHATGCDSQSFWA